MTVLFVLLGTMGFSQSYWVKYGWQAFNNAGDARILSLGGAAVTDFGTSVSPLFNPAASGKVGIHNLNYTHQSRLAGMINSDLLGFPIQNFSRPLNLIIIHEGIDQIPDTRNILLDFGLDGVPGTGDIGEGNGTLDEGERLDEDKVKYFSQRQLGLHLSTSWKNNNIEFGIAVKSLFHSIGEHTGSGIGLDFGVLAVPWKNGRLGLTIRDITTSWQVWENGTVERFKPSVMTGISHSHQFSNFPVSISGMVNIVSDGGGKSIDDDINLGNHGANIRFGFNGVYDNKIALRLGRNTIGSTTGGIGLSWDNLSLDYAFLNEPTGSGLGVSHMVSLSINYGWIRGMIDRL
ncbi:MAG: hypothetical protein QGI44_08325 [Candidatus Marinimicrobia bacterium]|nr:hypothetical protein [Candidatus Neomarinimicrobiota bacterium]MDP7331281.1 hypothetical protein [Candidatus Neomarinimicrobiota bacterium]